MRRRKKNKLYTFIIVFLLIDLLAVLVVINTSNARYESTAVSNTELEVALYALEEDDDYTISLNEMVPREEPYVYRFTVTNTDKNGRLSDVKLYYDLKIIATTNMHLNYKLYKNQNYLSPSANSIVNLDIVAPDEDGTFFRTLTTSRVYFGFEEVETNEYTLLVYFPETFKNSKYQDLIESIQINIDSQQVV